MYSQYGIEDLSVVSNMDPRMDIMQMPNSFTDIAADEIEKKVFFFVQVKFNFNSIFRSA